MKKIIICGLALAAILSSCTNKDLYDEDKDASKKQEEYNNNFPIKGLDPNQDWSTFTAVEAKITVNEDALETYTVKLYTANPMDEAANPLLLAKSDIKNGETTSLTIEIPKDLKSIWAVRLDKHNRCLFKQGAVKDRVVDVTFGNKTSSTNRSIATRAVTPPSVPFTDEQVKNWISSATILSDNMIERTGIYLIQSGTTITNLNVTAKETIIIVQGNVENANITDNSKLIINGSKAMLSGDITIDNSLLYVMPGSVFSLDNLIVNNNSEAYLKGEDNLESSITTLTSDATSKFVNLYGRLSMQTVTAANLENYCYININGQSTSTINNLKMGQHSYLSAQNLQSTKDNNTAGSDKKGEWYLNDFSIIDIQTNFRAIRTNIYGPEGYNYALLRIRKSYEYNAEGNAVGGIDVGYVANNIYVELQTLSMGMGTSIYKLVEALNGAGEIPGQVTQGNGNASLTLLFNAPVYVEPSVCSGEGNKPNDEGGDMPDDKKMAYTFAFEDLGSIGDYDFNDVVIQVTDGDENYKFNVSIAAAGGTLPVRIELWSESKNKYVMLWEEIHSAFGVPQSTIVNTGGTTITSLPKKENLYKGDYLKSELYSNALFKITVTSESGTKESNIISAPTAGSAPQCLRIAGDWKWPVERASITEAYPDFASWAQGNAGTEWTNNPKTELIYNN